MILFSLFPLNDMKKFHSSNMCVFSHEPFSHRQTAKNEKRGNIVVMEWRGERQ